MLAALRIVAARNPWLNVGVVAAAAAPPSSEVPVVVPSSNTNGQQYIVVLNVRRIPLTLAALVRVAESDQVDGAATAAVAEAEVVLTAATGKLRTAEQLHELAKLMMTVQSDYASQFQTHRIHTATCAQPERHNLLVSIVGYKPYTEMMRKPGRGRKNPVLEPVVKQHVDIFYAFHKAGYKPSARSFNVVQVCMLPRACMHFPLHACAFPLHCHMAQAVRGWLRTPFRLRVIGAVVASGGWLRTPFHLLVIGELLLPTAARVSPSLGCVDL
jgi:hypothetical protein